MQYLSPLPSQTGAEFYPQLHAKVVSIPSYTARISYNHEQDWPSHKSTSGSGKGREKNTASQLVKIVDIGQYQSHASLSLIYSANLGTVAMHLQLKN